MRDFLSDRYALGWDFDEHVAHGKTGGQDWQTKIGDPIYAPADGAFTTSGNVGTIRLDDGSRLRVRHMLSWARPRVVREGDRIGIYGGDGGLWGHWETVTVRGVRRPPAFLGMVPSEPDPTNPTEEDDMAVREVFPRNAETGDIYWEREPGAPLYKLSEVEYRDWLKAPAYLDLSPAQIAAWIATSGQAKTIAEAHTPAASSTSGAFDFTGSATPK